MENILNKPAVDIQNEEEIEKFLTNAMEKSPVFVKIRENLRTLFEEGLTQVMKGTVHLITLYHIEKMGEMSESETFADKSLIEEEPGENTSSESNDWSPSVVSSYSLQSETVINSIQDKNSETSLGYCSCTGTTIKCEEAVLAHEIEEQETHVSTVDDPTIDAPTVFEAAVDDPTVFNSAVDNLAVDEHTVEDSSVDGVAKFSEVNITSSNSCEAVKFPIFNSKKSTDLLAGDMNQQKKRQNWHKCYFCLKTFQFQFTAPFEVHLRAHTQEMPYICTPCGKEFTQSNHLDSHVVKCRVAKSKPFKCPHNPCSYSNKGERQLNMHIATAHSKQKYFSCRHCEKAFASKKSRDAHKRVHHLIQKRRSVRKRKTVNSTLN